MNLVRDVIRSFFRHDDFDLAAHISFYSLLSLIPLAMIMASIAGFILGNTRGIADEMARGILDVLPMVEKQFTANLHSLLDQRSSLGVVGLLFLFFIATLLVSSLERALGIVFQSVKRRNFFHSRLVGIGLICIISLLFFVPTMAQVFEGVLSRYGFHFPLMMVINGKLYVVLVAFLSYVVTVVVIPNHKVFLRYAVIGGLIFAGGMVLAKFFFRWYMTFALTRYNLIYGSLTAVVSLVVWIYYLALVMLIASEVVAAVQRSRRPDEEVSR